jgi:PAS domain S-box-containing protein
MIITITVLYIDDEPPLLEILRIILNGTKEFDVTTAQSAQEGLTALRSSRFDAIVSDYQMPGMDGIALLKLVRKEFGDMPFILFTGRGREEIVIQAIDNGADFYVQKGGEPKSQFAELTYKIKNAVERKQARETLRKNEARFETMLQGLPFPTFVIDREKRIIAWNHALEEFSGIPAQQVLGKTDAWQAFYPRERPTLADLIVTEKVDEIPLWYNETATPSLLTKGAYEMTEYFSQLHGGAWVIVTAAPIRDEDCQVIGAIEVLQDITEKRRYGEELQSTCEQMQAAFEEARMSQILLEEQNWFLNENERKYRNFFEISPDLIWECNTEGIFTSVSPSCDNYFGYSHGELTGKSWFSFLIDTDRPRVQELFSQMQEPHGNGSTIVCRALHRNGSCIIIEIRSTPILNEDGTLRGFQGVARDITQECRVHEDLQEYEHRYGEIFNNITDAIVLYEMKSGGIPDTYMEVNDIACRVLHYSREELHRMSPFDIETNCFNRPPGDIAAELRTFGYTRFETEYRRKDGIQIPVEIHAHTISIRGKPVVLSVFRDITDRRRTESAIHKITQAFRLFSQVSRHDIENNLTVIRGINLAMRKKTGDIALRALLEKQATALHALWQQLESTREYEQVCLDVPLWIDLEALIHKASSQLYVTPVPVTTDLGNWEIFSNTLVEKVFYNLIENAIRHGKNITRIHVSCSIRGESLVISCEDDGGGIPPDRKERILEKEYGNNTGLGLFLSRAILSMNGMEIKETGIFGKGARFEIVVPAGGYRQAREKLSGESVPCRNSAESS